MVCCDPSELLWLFRFHVNAEIWSDLSELFDPTPELKVSVHVFQRSDGFPGHSGVLFPILSVTVSALDPLWHTHALTHLTYIQYDTQPYPAGPWAALMQWPTGVFAFNGYLISLHQWDRSNFLYHYVAVHVSLHAFTAHLLCQKLCPAPDITTPVCWWSTEDLYQTLQGRWWKVTRMDSF